MKILRTSPYSKQKEMRELDVTIEQLSAWRNGALIQEVMPQLSPQDREFIMTGLTETDWTILFEEMDEDL